MTTNKPGSVNQQPLYGCTSCYEDYSWPAGDLRVFGSECWCGLCWDERRWGSPDLPYWDDLEPYTPTLQAECERLREEVRQPKGRANTRLIAAAPELYNALELFIAHYSEPDCPVARDVYNRALAALDKARNGDA